MPNNSELKHNQTFKKRKHSLLSDFSLLENKDKPSNKQLTKKSQSLNTLTTSTNTDFEKTKFSYLTALHKSYAMQDNVATVTQPKKSISKPIDFETKKVLSNCVKNQLQCGSKQKHTKLSDISISHTDTNLELEEKNSSDCNSDNSDSEHSDNDTEFFTDSDLQKYVLQQVFRKSIRNNQDNTDFLQQVKTLYKNIDNIVLDKNQQKLVDIIGKEMFPKKFKPYMFDIALGKDGQNFIDYQINKYENFIIKKGSRRRNYITALIPYYLIIQENDSESLMYYKMQAIKKMKIQYIACTNAFKSIENQLKTHEKINNTFDYKAECVFTFADKLEQKNKPCIFVFVPDNYFDENMQLKEKISTNNIKAMFFENGMYFKQFEFGICKFYAYFQKEHTKDHSKRKITSVKEDFTYEDSIQELKLLDRRIKAMLVKIQNGFFNKAFNKSLEPQLQLTKNTNKRKAEQDKTNDTKRIKQDLSQIKLCLSQDFSYNKTKQIQENKLLFQQIDEKIFNQYREDIVTDKNIIDKLTLMCGLNIEEYLLNTEKINQIKQNVNSDIERLVINDCYNLQRPSSAIVLLPLTQYLNLYDSKETIQHKIENIEQKKIPIERHHCVYLGKTPEKILQSNPEKHKLVVALAKEINVENTYIDQKAIILINNTHISYNNQDLNINLFDPNKFTLKGYFYSNVTCYKDIVNYPLYEFQLGKEFNMSYKDFDIYRRNYIDEIQQYNNTKTKKLILLQHLSKAYKDFDNRALDRAKDCQIRSKPKDLKIK